MVKLTNILTELLNNYIVQAFILTDTSYNITTILDQIRAVNKITIVRNITPEDFLQKPNVEYTLVTIKFITRGDAQKDLIQFKNDMLTSDFGGNVNDMKVEGLKFIEFKPKTLRRI